MAAAAMAAVAAAAAAAAAEMKMEVVQAEANLEQVAAAQIHAEELAADGPQRRPTQLVSQPKPSLCLKTSLLRYLETWCSRSRPRKMWRRSTRWAGRSSVCLHTFHES